jgi:hypothetical protein
MSRTLTISAGVGLFALGGLLLAYGGEGAGVPIGTVCGIAGLGLVIRAWLGRGAKSET